MGEVIQTGDMFREVPGLGICLSCGDSWAALVPGSTKTDSLECRTCHDQNSAFVSARTLRRVIELAEE